jgi:hypothetical protein
MAGIENNEINFPGGFDDFREKIACQEEIYLEKNEEEIRAILIVENPTPPQESLREQWKLALEDLITGDLDDPPLSDKVIEEMLNTELRPLGLAKRLCL